MNLGLHFVVGLPKADLDFETRRWLRAIRPSGVILFARNIPSPEQAADLTRELRALLGEDLLLCIDHEGGRVNRLRDHLGVIPSAQQLGILGSAPLARRHGVLAGRLLRLLGLNWNLAPVLDLALKREVDNAISDRTFSADPAEVTRLSAAFCAGLLSQGVIPCGKHFPGYGAANKDPHKSLPVIDRTLKQLREEDLVPYKNLLQARPSPLPSLMTAHGHFPAVHPDPRPASVSGPIMNGWLRRRLRYKGIVITDDLEMGGITQVMSVGEACVQTLRAGIDFNLICHTPDLMLHSLEAVEKALRDGTLKTRLLEPSARRIARFKKRVPKPLPYSPAQFARLREQTARFTGSVLEKLPAARRKLDSGLAAVGEK
ncbi:MAG: beta-N-acetylhexosaminidase [Verrucomicrobiae bacterium]|nr:beta-N-acetylhexosaminidase [Verrucomicrobiae bacterium]